MDWHAERCVLGLTAIARAKLGSRLHMAVPPMAIMIGRPGLPSPRRHRPAIALLFSLGLGRENLVACSEVIGVVTRGLRAMGFDLRHSVLLGRNLHDVDPLCLHYRSTGASWKFVWGAQSLALV